MKHSTTDCSCLPGNAFSLLMKIILHKAYDWPGCHDCEAAAIGVAACQRAHKCYLGKYLVSGTEPAAVVKLLEACECCLETCPVCLG